MVQSAESQVKLARPRFARASLTANPAYRSCLSVSGGGTCRVSARAAIDMYAGRICPSGRFRATLDDE